MTSRRSVLTRLFCASAIVNLGLHQFSAAQRSPQPLPSPHAPDPHFPPGLDGPDIKPESGTKKIDPSSVKEIREKIDQLYVSASALKAQADKIDFSTAISVPLMKKAKEIEKLAKRIEQLSRE